MRRRSAAYLAQRQRETEIAIAAAHQLQLFREQGRRAEAVKAVGQLDFDSQHPTNTCSVSLRGSQSLTDAIAEQIAGTDAPRPRSSAARWVETKPPRCPNANDSDSYRYHTAVLTASRPDSELESISQSPALSRTSDPR